MTAEKIFKKHWEQVSWHPLDDVVKSNMKYCIIAMQEYARLKCEELLEIVAEKAETKTVTIPNGLNIKTCVVDRDSMLNAVDLDKWIN